MEEILHRFIGSLSHYLQGVLTSQVVSRISSINSIIHCAYMMGFLVVFFSPSGLSERLRKKKLIPGVLQLQVRP